MDPSLQDFSEYINKVPDASNMCFGIVVAEKHPEVSSSLLAGCIKTLEDNGAYTENIHVKTVPGCSELVYGAHQMTLRGCYDAVIILGCIIKGETPYFDFQAQSISLGITNLNAKGEVPIIFGVLTTLNKEQALERAGGSKGNIGSACAIDAIKMSKF